MNINNSGLYPENASGAYNASSLKVENTHINKNSLSQDKNSFMISQLKSDSITLSDNAGVKPLGLKEIKEKLVADLSADKDPQYLLDLKQKIESGKYEIDVDKISEKILF